MIEVFDCDQGGEEWHRLRLGIPTASEFSTVLAEPKKGANVALTRRVYMYKLAGERISGRPMFSYTNVHMERGRALEDEARDRYAFLMGVTCERVGFVRAGDRGCSPDSLIGEDGGLEIKTALEHILIEKLLRDEFPAEHWAQVQGNMLVTGRAWWDLAIYCCEEMPLFRKRAFRDERYLAELDAAISTFNRELSAIEHRIRSYRMAA